MGGGVLLLRQFPAAAGALRLRLVLVLGAVKQPLGHVHDGAVAGGQGQEEAAEDADDGAAQLGEQADKDLAQQAAQGAAGLQLLAAGPQGLNKRGVPGQDLAEQPVEHHREGQGQGQGAAQPQGHRAAPVEGQDIGAQEQGRGHQPEAIAQQALQQGAEQVDEQGLHVKIAKGGEDGQQQADQRAHLPAEGLGGGGSPVLGGAGAGGGGPAAAARGALPAGGPLSAGGAASAGGSASAGGGAAAARSLFRGCHGDPVPFVRWLGVSRQGRGDQKTQAWTNVTPIRESTRKMAPATQQ